MGFVADKVAVNAMLRLGPIALLTGITKERKNQNKEEKKESRKEKERKE